MNKDESEFNLSSEINPLINIYTKILVEKLVDKGILKIGEESQDGQSYVFVKQQTDADLDNTSLSNNDFRLIDLKKLLWEVLKHFEISPQQVNSDLINPEYIKLTKISINTVELVKAILETGELIEDKSFLEELNNLYKRDSDLTKIYIEVLRYIIFVITKESFEEYDFNNETTSYTKRFDYSLRSRDSTLPEILIEIKYWRRHIGRIEDLINQNSKFLESFTNIRVERNPILIVIIITNEKVKEDINEKSKKILPNYKELSHRLKLVTIPISRIQDLKHQLLNEHELIIDENSILESTLTKSPVIINKKEKYQINSQILKLEKGSILVWVKVLLLQELLNSTVNNRYIISHDTNVGHTKNGKYVNAFAISLHPDPYQSPMKVNWRLWFSNKSGDYLDIDFDGEFDKTTWNLFTIRWDHSSPKLEIFLNNILVAKQEDYLHYWPEEISDKIFIGNWVSLDDVHNLGMPIFRLIVFKRCISDSMISNEWRRRSNLEGMSRTKK